MTHVLLPVTVLARRADAVEVIGEAVVAHAGGQGHRRIGLALGAPDTTVRGWLRVLTKRLEPARLLLWQVAARAGVDLSVPSALGSPWRDLLAALGAAMVAVTGRFGPVGVLGPVTAWQVAAACSVGCWPRAGRRSTARWSQHQLPLPLRADSRKPREGSRPAGLGRVVSCRIEVSSCRVPLSRTTSSAGSGRSRWRCSATS
jgi:hypothetical protein